MAYSLSGRSADSSPLEFNHEHRTDHRRRPRELGPHGVLVNAVAPGPTQTAMYDQLPQSRKDGVMKSVYSGRVCTPEEVASAILWLGTSCPEYVNGTTLDVNNGSYPR
jgi:3-oxoacyl-[acyl-carrier protein] reductase